MKDLDSEAYDKDFDEVTDKVVKFITEGEIVVQKLIDDFHKKYCNSPDHLKEKCLVTFHKIFAIHIKMKMKEIKSKSNLN